MGWSGDKWGKEEMLESQKRKAFEEKKRHKIHSTLYNSSSYKANLKSYFLNLSKTKILLCKQEKFTQT